MCVHVSVSLWCVYICPHIYVMCAYVCVWCVYICLCICVSVSFPQTSILLLTSDSSSENLFPLLGILALELLPASPSLHSNCIVCGTGPHHFPWLVSLAMVVDLPQLGHYSAKSLQCPHIRMKPRFLSPKGLSWFSTAQIWLFSYRSIFLQANSMTLSPTELAVFNGFVYLPGFFLHLLMPPFLNLSNSYFPFNILSDIIPPGNRAQHPIWLPYLQHSNPVPHPHPPPRLGAPCRGAGSCSLSRISRIWHMPGIVCSRCW